MGPPERAGLGAGGLRPAASRGPRGQCWARMATPDQKSPNVLLQNLCCRILGKSEGSRFGPGASSSEARPGSCSLRVELGGAQGTDGAKAGWCPGSSGRL